MSNKAYKDNGVTSFLKRQLMDSIIKRDENIEKRYRSQQRIFDALSDGQWHQYKELKNTTKLSYRTLAKHLKAMMEEKMIERKKDTESGKYPIPTLYKASTDLYEFLQDQIRTDEWLKEIEKNYGSIDTFINRRYASRRH